MSVNPIMPACAIEQPKTVMSKTETSHVILSYLPNLSNWRFNIKTEKPVTRYKEMKEKPKGKNTNNNDGQFPKQDKYG